MTRTILAFFASSFLTVSMSIPARAEEIDGLIAAIDEDSETLTLTDGSTYRLPNDFNYRAVGPGMPVVLLCEPRARLAEASVDLRLVDRV